MNHSPVIKDVPSVKELYKRLVNRIVTKQPIKKLQLKQQVQDKYKQHMSLLQSHKKRELRFQENSVNINKIQQEKIKSLQKILREKQESNKKTKLNLMNIKKKKMEQYLDVWKNTVEHNRKKYQNTIRESTHSIKKWNQKCQNSIKKKKQRLNTVSSRISERSRISSAKTIKYQQQQYQKMLQKSLINPQNSWSILKAAKGISSRVSTTSNISYDRNRQNYQKNQICKNEQFLNKLLSKQKRIVQARNKKNQLISKFKIDYHNKQTQIAQIHKQNTNNLKNQRDNMYCKLDAKFFKERTNKKEANRSLPAVNLTNNMLETVNSHKYQKYHSIKMKQLNARTVQHNFDKLIMDELRSITVVQKIRRQLK